MAPKAVLVGMPGSGSRRSGAGWPRPRARRSWIPTPRSSRLRVARSPRSSPPTAKPSSVASRKRSSRPRSPSTTASSRSAAARSPARACVTRWRPHRRVSGNQCRRRGSAHDQRYRAATAGGGDPAEKFRKLMTERVPLYRRVATLRVNTNRRNPGAVVRYLAARLENPEAARPTKAARRRRRPPWRQSGSQQAAPAAPAESAQEPSPRPSPPTPATPAALAARRSEVRK